jgi:hypothetical protein
MRPSTPSSASSSGRCSPRRGVASYLATHRDRA